MQGTTLDILNEVKAAVLPLYGNRLRGVYLFGSYSRGEADQESDFDVLLVLDSLSDYAAEIDLTGEAISCLSLEHGVSISRCFVSEEDWLARSSLFLREIGEEVIAA